MRKQTSRVRTADRFGGMTKGGPRCGSYMLLLIVLRTVCWGDAPPTISVPSGFVVGLVAAPPLVEHPMMACFDERGRLFVTEAAGVNMNAEDLLKNHPNSIRLLEDTDGDGKFDKATTFA